eukprot:2364467-Pleurochrysis_carterae.AAC.1
MPRYTRVRSCACACTYLAACVIYPPRILAFCGECVLNATDEAAALALGSSMHLRMLTGSKTQNRARGSTVEVETKEAMAQTTKAESDGSQHQFALTKEEQASAQPKEATVLDMGPTRVEE